jgi:hypothetical protein
MAEQPSKHGTTPIVASCDPDGIPEPLRAVDCWVAWASRLKDGRWGKIPLDPEGHEFVGRSPAPYSYARALGQGMGVGVIAGKHGEFHIAAGDADDAVGDEWVEAKLRELNTYCEKSPSGRGYRFLFLTKAPFLTLEGRRAGRELKVSCTSFWTVTGRRVEWSPVGLADLTEQHPTLLADLFGTADLDRRCAQLLRWIEPITLAEPEGEAEVYAALEHLAGWRVVEYRGWIRVIWCLASGGPAYFPMACEWSRQCPEKYAKGAEALIAEQFAKGPPYPWCTLRQLRWWAHQDDPSYEPPGGWHEDLTTVGNANIVARVAAGRLLHVDEWGAWAAWDSRRWQHGGKAPWKGAMDAAKEAARARERQVRGSRRRLEEAEAAAGQLTDESVRAAVLAAAEEKKRGLRVVMAWVKKSKNLRGFAGISDILGPFDFRLFLILSESGRIPEVLRNLAVQLLSAI